MGPPRLPAALLSPVRTAVCGMVSERPCVPGGEADGDRAGRPGVDRGDDGGDGRLAAVGRWGSSGVATVAGGVATVGGGVAAVGRAGWRFAGGARAQVADNVRGVADLGRWAWRSATSVEQRRANGRLWVAVRADPGGALASVWEGVTDPVVSDWQAGRREAAVGRGVAVAGIFFGGKGLQHLRRLTPDVDGLARRLHRDESGALHMTNDAPRARGLADEAATVGRSASTEWGRVVQDFQQHGDDWTRFSAHVERATGRKYRGGTSIEEFRRGDDWLVRHRIYGPSGDVLHETFRPYSKFGR